MKTALRSLTYLSPKNDKQRKSSVDEIWGYVACGGILGSYDISCRLGHNRIIKKSRNKSQMDGIEVRKSVSMYWVEIIWDWGGSVTIVISEIIGCKGGFQDGREDSVRSN